MTVLITGGGGFVGQALAERLVADGRRAATFDRLPPRPGSVASVQHVQGDIRDRADIARALAETGATCVVHLAAITPDARRERDDPSAIVEVNIGGTIALLDAVAAAPQVRRVVVMSSVAVYGFSPPAASGFYDEGLSPPQPAALYGITKLASEQAALRIGGLRGLDVRAVRLGPVYGRWEVATGVRDALSPHHQVVRMAQAGLEVVLPRPMRADWIYARDAAAGIAGVALGDRLQHPVYHLGGGAMSDLPTWCALVARRWPSLRWRIAAPGEAPTVIYGLPADRAALDLSRLAADTGFAPAFAPEQAFADYLAWMDAPERRP
jgi:UDP-glucose 4-epimerase/UDP-glucuronate 4-epimerase